VLGGTPFAQGFTFSGELGTNKHWLFRKRPDPTKPEILALPETKTNTESNSPVEPSNSSTPLNWSNLILNNYENESNSSTSLRFGARFLDDVGLNNWWRDK